MFIFCFVGGDGLGFWSCKYTFEMIFSVVYLVVLRVGLYYVDFFVKFGIFGFEVVKFLMGMVSSYFFLLFENLEEKNFWLMIVL